MTGRQLNPSAAPGKHRNQAGSSASSGERKHRPAKATPMSKSQGKPADKGVNR